MDYEVIDASGDYYAEDMSYNFAENLDEVDNTPQAEKEFSNDYNEEVVEEEDFLEEESEYEEEDIDPFDPDYFKAPDTFSSTEEELEWYRDRMDSVRHLVDQDSNLYRSYAEETRQQLVEKLDLEYEGFSIMHEALQTDARGFLLQFIPEALAEHGINPIMSEQELLERVEQDLQKEYGNDYRMRLNTTEVFNPRSFTAQVWAKQQSLIREWDSINARNKEIMSKWNETIASSKQNSQTQVKQGPSQAELDQAYEQHFKQKYDRQSFDAMMASATQKEFTFQDLERVMHFDKFIEEAYQRGLKEASNANKQRFDSAAREGNVIKAQDTRRVNQPANVDTGSVTYDFESFFNGNIPYY